MLDVLALSPHPDDIELCCGGLLAKMSEKRYRIGIIDLTRGELGTEGTADTRMQEATLAAEILGVQVRRNMDFGDCRLSNNFDHAKKLAGIIREHKPTLLIAPYGDDHHPDHAAAGKLSRNAAFLAKLTKIKLEHEAHRGHATIYYMLHKVFRPSFIVDVTEHYKKKLDAIRAYQSQMNLMLGPSGLLRSVELRDELYGSKIGAERGEPFLSIKSLKIDDPVAFLR